MAAFMFFYTAHHAKVSVNMHQYIKIKKRSQTIELKFIKIQTERKYKNKQTNNKKIYKEIKIKAQNKITQHLTIFLPRLSKDTNNFMMPTYPIIFLVRTV
jgi:hypothetical protein